MHCTFDAGRARTAPVDDVTASRDDTFEDAGIEGSFREIAMDEDAPPTHILYYDYRWV